MGSYQKNKGRADVSRHVRLDHYLLKSQAYQGLSIGSRALYTELKMRYNGYNNGEIGMSVREASSSLQVHRDTVRKFFNELLDKGFIKIARKGEFRIKNRTSTEYILTELPYNNQKPTKDFMRWAPQ